MMKRALFQCLRKRPQLSKRSQYISRASLHPNIVERWCSRALYSSASSSSTFLHKRDVENASTESLINSPVGSINEEGWEEAVTFFRDCNQQPDGVLTSFRLLDRLTKEEGFRPRPDLLNSIILNWRNQFIENKRTHSSILPSKVVDKVREWTLLNSALQTDTKTYAMIMEAAAHCTENHSEGVVFAQSLLEWMLKESKSRYSIQPTIDCFATVMNGWVRSRHFEAPTKVEEWIHRLTALHEEGWPDLHPNTVVYNILLNAWSQTGNVEKTEQVLQAMLQREVEAYPDCISFTTMLSAYCRQRRPEGVASAETLLSQMHEMYQAGMEDAKPNIVSYTIVMNGHALLGQAEEAAALLQRIEDMYRETQDPDWMPDVAAYNTVLLAWARVNQPERADQLLRFMYEDGVVKPDERSFNAVLSAWAQAGDPDMAETILTRMHEFYADGELETKPTVVTYNTVLDSLAKSRQKDAWKRSEEILKHMEALYQAGDVAVKPNARTWNTVLNSFAKAGKIGRAERLVDEFTKAFKFGQMDERPNLRSWNTLLAACMERGDIQRAKGFFRRMKEHGIHPDIISFNTVLSCCARSSQHRYLAKEIETLAREIHQDSSLTPNRITYLALINAWIGAGRLGKAEAVLKDMCSNHAKDRIPIDRDLFHKVLQAWSTQKSPRRAESLFLTMADLHDRHGFDLKPTVHTYNRLLNAWAKSMETESGERADLILRQMQEISVSGDEDVSPDLVSYNSVLNAWANSGDPTAVTRAEHLVMEMILKGNPNLAPTEVSYGTWLKAIANSNEDDKGRRANGVLETMEIHKLEPTEKILNWVANLANPKDTK